jgi:hypothetical protein
LQISQRAREEAQLFALVGPHPNLEAVGALVVLRNSSSSPLSSSSASSSFEDSNAMFRPPAEEEARRAGNGGHAGGFRPSRRGWLGGTALELRRPRGLRPLAASPTGRLGRPMKPQFPARHRFSFGCACLCVVRCLV